MSNEELTGRELDIAIAERVMDWLPPGDPATKAMRSRLRLTHPSYNDHYLTPEGELRKPPYYLADIVAAMEVVEKMESLNYQWQFSRTNPIKSIHDNKPHVEFWTYREGVLQPVAMATADTLSEAICRAALASLPEIKDREDKK